MDITELMYLITGAIVGSIVGSVLTLWLYERRVMHQRKQGALAILERDAEIESKQWQLVRAMQRGVGAKALELFEAKTLSAEQKIDELVEELRYQIYRGWCSVGREITEAALSQYNLQHYAGGVHIDTDGSYLRLT